MTTPFKRALTPFKNAPSVLDGKLYPQGEKRARGAFKRVFHSAPISGIFSIKNRGF